MSLRRKAMVIFLLALVLLAVSLNFIHQNLITRRFNELEVNQMREAVMRADTAIRQSLHKLAVTVQDWAPWDDTYTFLKGENERYPAENLISETFANLELNLVMMTDASGKPIYAWFFNLQERKFEPVPPNVLDQVLAVDWLVATNDSQRPENGIVMTDLGPMLVASHPVLKSDYTGPPAGSLIMGRLINIAFVSQLSVSTRLNMAVLPLDATGNGLDADLRSDLARSDLPVVKALSDREVAGFRLIKDIKGRPVAILVVREPRSIYEFGLRTASASFWLLTTIGALFTLLSWFLLERTILFRWRRLDREVQDIGRSMDSNRRVFESGSDEIGRLASSINNMLGNLQTANERRREMEDRFSRAFENAAVGMALVDPSGRFTATNPFLQELLGYSDEELSGRRFSEITHPQDHTIGLQAVKDMMAGNQDYALFEKRYLHKTGRVVWGMVSMALIRDEERRPLYFVSLFQDISQQKQAEQERREYSKQLRMITDNLPVLIAFVDSDQRYRFVNREYEKWFGLSPDDVVGMSVREIVGETGYAAVREGIETVLSGRPVSYEGDMPVPGGGQRCFFSRNIPHVNDDGVVDGYFVLAEDITERKMAEEVLSRTREQYELLAKNTADLVALCNSAAEFTFVSPSYETQLGYRSDELLGRPITELVHPDDLPVILDIIAERYRNPDPEPVTIEYRLRHKDGQYLWFETRGQILFDDLGQPSGAMFNTRNVTERKRAEQALRESEALFSSFMYHLPAEAFIKDAQGRYIFASEGYRTILGFDPQDRIGKTDFELFSPDVASFLIENDNIVRQTGRSLEQLEPIADSTGREHAQLTVKFPISHPSGSGVVAGIAMDITDRVRAEEELRDSEEKYRTILQSTVHSITITEVETGRFHEVNDGFVNFTGYSREETLGKTPTELNLFVNPKDRDKLIDTLKRYGHVTGAAVQYQSKAGVIMDSIFSAKPLRYAGLDCLVAVVQDVTSLREAEREQARLLSQLQQAQKMEAVGTLAGGIAHDFNNILQAITGYLELLRRQRGQNSTARKYINEIDAVSRRAADLVRQLLTFSRKVDPTLKPVSLNDTVRQTVSLLERTIPRMININTLLDDNLDLILADSNQIEQVLMNLATNARDAMPLGGTLLIETSNFQVDGDARRNNPALVADEYVVMRVSDTGEGMDEETLKNIFTPFFTTKGVGQGTGLGLAMVYGIVQAHDGYIRCDSEPGHGTSFSIFLPVFKGYVQDASEDGQDFESDFRGTETVLLVDDEPGIIEVAGEMLRQYGYNVISAGSGEEALAKLRSAPSALDVVILDLSMPGMGGVKCLEEMARIRPDLKAIVASGYSRDSQAERLQELGVADYLQKPYKLTEMMTTLRHVIDNGDAGSA